MRYRRLRNITLVVLIGGCLVDFFSPSMYSWATGAQDDSRFSAIFFVVWAAASIFAGSRLMKWPCPRCGEIFSGGVKALDRPGAWFNWIFLPKQCVSCGLRKFTASPEADSGETPG